MPGNQEISLFISYKIKKVSYELFIHYNTTFFLLEMQIENRCHGNNALKCPITKTLLCFITMLLENIET